MSTLGVLSIMFMTLGVVGFLTFASFAAIQENGFWMIGCLITALFLVAPGAIMYVNTPNKQDVLNGNAHYVKEINYQEYDTITTYRIEFNEDYYLGKPAKKHKKSCNQD